MSDAFKTLKKSERLLTAIPYTELANKNRSILNNVLPLELPYSLHIEPTNICNFGCVSCPQSLDSYKEQAGYYELMDFELFTKIIDDIANVGKLKALKLFGYGESLLHPRLPEMIKYAKSKNMTDRIEITTNATKLTPKVAGELIESGLDYLRVSIYSIDQDTHNQFTQTRFSVEKIFDNLKGLIELRNNLNLNHPFIYAKVMETLKDEEIREFKKKYSEVADELTVEVIHNMSGINGIEQKLGIDIPVRKNRKICPLPFYQASIAANGDVTICCIDWTFSSKIGNVKENNIIDLWKSDKFNKIRSEILRGNIKNIPSCTNCTWSWSSTDDLDTLTDAEKNELLKEYEA